MKYVKTVDNGTLPPNTIEIQQSLCYPDTFDEKIIFDAGFQIKKLSVTGETSLSSQRISNVQVCNDWTIQSSVNISQSYSIPTIIDCFNTKLAALKKFNADVTWAIKELILSKGQNRYKFKVCGNKANKRMILMEMNTVGHHLVDLDHLMKEFCDIFETKCFFKPATSTPPMMCQPKN